MEDFSDLFIGDVIVDYFLHSDSENVSDGSVPKYVQLIDVRLAECPGLTSPE